MSNRMNSYLHYLPLFASSLTDARANIMLLCHNTKRMEEAIMQKLEAIEQNMLLASKTVLMIQDVSALTGLSASTIYQMTSKHQIPHYKPTGRLLYFDRQEVEAWMKQNRIGTISEAQQAASKHIVSKKYQ